MADLRTRYLGLELKNPFIASASPLSKKVDTVRRLEDNGASAVVLYSLFEEQIVHESNKLDRDLERGAGISPEAEGYFPDLGNYNLEPDQYVDHVRKVKKAVSIPVIGSLNGVSPGGWTSYAKRIEEAGADALELNIYRVPTSLDKSAGELEAETLALVRQVKDSISIPLAVKIGPFYTSLPHLASGFRDCGARGLVLFNRFLQPEIDPENLDVVSSLALSTSDELRLPLRWIAILAGRVDLDLAATGGIHSGRDAVKAVMAGASALMIASELVARGPGRISEIVAEFAGWMERREYVSVEQMRGAMSQRKVADPAAFERANYMKALSSWDDRLAS